MLLCNSFTECIGLYKALSCVLSSSFRMIDIIEVVTHALQISFIQKPLIYFKGMSGVTYTSGVVLKMATSLP